jgi:N-acetylmuramoyl-L-alanine amidase
MKIMQSSNFNNRPQDIVIDSIIIHATGMDSCESVLNRLCDVNSEVSAHYVIDRDGTVYNLVDPSHRAWHAGISNFKGRSGFNDFSVGIELVNFGYFTLEGDPNYHDFGQDYDDFPDVQIDALINLMNDLYNEFPIAKNWVLQHSDISPSRRADPGPKFPWCKLKDKNLV